MAAKKVFISYNHQDRPVAERLKTALEEHGLLVIIDNEAMSAGSGIQAFIERSVREADVTLSLVSNRSLLSAWVALESVTAFYSEKLQDNKKFIACYLDDDFFQPDFRVKATERIDARIEEIEQLIPRHLALKIDLNDLNAEHARLHKLRANLGEILLRLKDSLTLDVRESEFKSSIERITKAIDEIPSRQERFAADQTLNGGGGSGGSSSFSLNPYTALTSAIAQIPQLKYALGVLGLAAVVAIGITWIADPKLAVFGIFITIALMYLLAIFAQSISDLPGLRWLAAFIAWSIAVLFVTVLAMLISSYAWGKPELLSNRLFPPTSSPTPTPSPAPDLPSLFGTVVDQGGKFIQGARVTIDELPQVKSSETSSDGVFKFKDLPVKYGDDVRIRVIADGYRPNPWTEDVKIGAAPPRVVLSRSQQ